jgi:hypothetical protein
VFVCLFVGVCVSVCSEPHGTGKSRESSGYQVAQCLHLRFKPGVCQAR